MKVRGISLACHSHRTYLLSAAYLLPTLDIHIVQMAVMRGVAAFMLDFHKVAQGAEMSRSLADHAIRGSIYGSSATYYKIDPAMEHECLVERIYLLTHRRAHLRIADRVERNAHRRVGIVFGGHGPENPSESGVHRHGALQQGISLAVGIACKAGLGYGVAGVIHVKTAHRVNLRGICVKYEAVYVVVLVLQACNGILKHLGMIPKMGKGLFIHPVFCTQTLLQVGADEKRAYKIQYDRKRQRSEKEGQGAYDNLFNARSFHLHCVSSATRKCSASCRAPTPRCVCQSSNGIPPPEW